VLPFALFMGVIGLEELAGFLREVGALQFDPRNLMFLYPAKVLLAGLAMVFFRSRYGELRGRDVAVLPQTALSVAVGMLVFVLWINMDWTLAVAGRPAGFNPAAFENPALKTTMTVTRFVGAAAVVPVMEELFWRSFLIRYLIGKDFSKVPIGQFTWMSFLATSVLFGLEHHLFLAGVMAGAAYNAVLYKTRSISQCVLAHAATNCALALYVLATGQWRFW
jgi:CAAX prenyl protease-like protein